MFPTYNFLKFYFTKLIDLTGIDILSMSRAPVNSLNTELLISLKTSLLEAKNSHSKGIILTSSLPTVFSAGIDIMELYNTDKNKLTTYWHAIQDAWLTLYSLDIPTAAAINVQRISPKLFNQCILYLYDNVTNCTFSFYTGFLSCWRLSACNVYRIQSIRSRQAFYWIKRNTIRSRCSKMV